VEKCKHGEMLPSTVCAIICGPSNYDKINVLISLLENQMLYVSRTYIFIQNRYNS